MIATILPSTSTFHAVNYNEHKVSKGVAALLEIKNFGEYDKLGYDNPEQLVEYLKEYSAQNTRIKNPQFHMALSCKGHEMTEQELVEFAHEYLKEMGYGDDGQPLLIYAHRDTDNTHLHIVTSRVDPRGKKISDSNERRKSQKVLEKLMGRNVGKEAKQHVREALEFDFRSLTQFKAVLEAMGYECYERGGLINVKKGGVVQTRIDISNVEHRIETNKQKPMDSSDNMKWRAIFKKYRDLNSSKSGLEKDLRSMFGLSVVWFGKKDSPYGYAVVDFNKKKVLEGGKILSVKDLLDFRTPEEHAESIEHFIDKCMEESPLITTYELNKKLRRMGGYVKKDIFMFGNHRQLLKPIIAERLKRNNMISYIESFAPASESERDLLCSINRFTAPDMIQTPKATTDYKPESIQLLTDILNKADFQTEFQSSGWRMLSFESGMFAYNRENRTIVDMSKTNIPYERYKILSNVNAGIDTKSLSNSNTASDSRNHGTSYNPSGTRFPKSGPVQTGRGENREWEVGKKGYDPDDMDNQNKGMGY